MTIGAINKIDISQQLEITASYKSSINLTKSFIIDNKGSNQTEFPGKSLAEHLPKMGNNSMPDMKNELTKFIESESNNLTTPGSDYLTAATELGNHVSLNNQETGHNQTDAAKSSSNRYAILYNKNLKNAISHSKKIWIDILA